MNLEKVKRKIAEGYNDSEIANMSGMTVEEIEAKVKALAPTTPPVVEPAPEPEPEPEPVAPE
jgi:hypothetical protein